MSLYDYEKGLEIGAKNYPFYALIQAAMRQADTDNSELLRRAFPRTHDELLARYHAPGGVLPTDEDEQLHIRIINTPAPKESEHGW